MATPVKAVAKKAVAKKAAGSSRTHGATTYYEHTPGKGRPPAQLVDKPSSPAVDAAGDDGAGGRASRVTGAASSLTPNLGIDQTLAARRILAAELLIGSALILASPEARSQDEPYTSALRQEAYFLGVMLVLAVLSMGGRETARIAAAMGSLVVLALAVRALSAGVIGKSAGVGSGVGSIAEGG